MASARALRFGKAVIELSLLTGDVQKQLKTVETQIRNTGKAISSIGSTGLKITGAIAGLAAFPVKMAADMELARAQFTAMLGDANKANKIISELEAFALVSPLGAADLQEAAKTLMNFGVESDNVVGTLKQLGNIAGGDSEKMKRLALAFGQVHAKGRLMGGEVLQMVDAGFSPLKEISRTTGESMLQLQKRMEAGGISATEVANSFVTATGAGGRFHGMIDAMSKTTTGQFNSLMESIQAATRPIGEALLPMLREYMARIGEIVPRVATWIKENRSLIESIGRQTVKIGIYSAAIVAVGTVITKLADTATITRTALLAMAGNPVLTAVAALTAGIILLDQKLNNVEATAKRVGVTLEGVKRELSEFESDKAGKGGYFTDNQGRPLLFAPTGYDDGTASWGQSRPATADDYRKMPAQANANPSAPFANQPSWNADVGMLKIGNPFNRGMQAIGDAAFTAADSIIRGASRFNESLEMQLEIGNTLQGLEDETQRARIALMEDGIAKEKALLNQEHAERLRDLEKNGLLNDGTRAALAELMGLQEKGLKDLGNDRVMQAVATFDARNSRQMFGGPAETIQRQQLAELKKLNAKNGGVPVVP